MNGVTSHIYYFNFNYLIIRGGSLKKIEKKIIPKVPTNKKVYTKASIKSKINFNFFELRPLGP